jgi:hypothetical protein
VEASGEPVKAAELTLGMVVAEGFADLFLP